MYLRDYINFLLAFPGNTELFTKTGDYDELREVSKPEISGISIGLCGLSKTPKGETSWKQGIII